MASVIQGSAQANPIRPLHPRLANLTWIGGRIPLGLDQFFAAPGQGPTYDYPNPKIPTPPVVNKTWTFRYNLNLMNQGKTYDYPNPARSLLERASLNKTWTDSYKLPLIGKDTFFSSPGRGPNYDY